MANAEHKRLFSIVFNVGLQLHRELGPGLMESVYETVLATRLERAGFSIERQKPVSIIVDNVTFPDAYRVDLLVNSLLVIEIKSLEKLTSLHFRQALTVFFLFLLFSFNKKSGTTPRPSSRFKW
jgi:GxxExxY protein